MSSVEGLWNFQSGTVQDPNRFLWGGVVVLESGKVLGGDSAMAYVGTYEVDRDRITAKVHSWLWNKELAEAENVFGMTGEIDYEAILEGRRLGDVIEGTVSPIESPQFGLPCRMTKLAELP